MASLGGSSIKELFEPNDIWSYEVEVRHCEIFVFSFIYLLLQPKLEPGRNHRVLFQLPLPRDDQLPQPHRAKLQALWDNDHVRLPFSKESQFAEIDESGNKSLKPRWDLIEESLLQPILTSRDLEKAIKKYNSRYEDIWKFTALHQLFDNFLPPDEVTMFFHKLLPAIINIALQLPQLIQSPIPLLKKGMNQSISLSQQQVASLLANAFLCTFPLRNTDKRNSEFASYPKINFFPLYCASGHNIIEKLKCIINYFHRVLLEEMPINTVTFQRKSIDVKYTWESSDDRLSSTKFQITSVGRIEGADGMLQVDFANRFVGGGVIGHGCVQEEIRFVINPEMIVARLFTQSLDNEEALIMIGCEQFNCYHGYASSFEWGGNFKDKTPIDNARRRKCRVVAIDALFYKTLEIQFKQASIRRELNKAFVGFSSESDRTPIASGLWGCGAFNGNTIRSALIQFMACTATKRNLALYTFGDVQVRDQITDIFGFLVKENVTVGKLYAILKTFQPVDPNHLIPFIKNELSIAQTNLLPSYCLQQSTPANKIRLKPKMKQSNLFNFVKVPSVDQKKVERDRSSSSETSFQPSTSTQDQAAFVLKDKQRFEEIANTFATCDKRTKKPAKSEKRTSLIDALDFDMEASSRK